MPKKSDREIPMKLSKRSKFRDVCNAWIKQKEKTIKLSSTATYRNTLEKYILPFFGDMTYNQANKSEEKFYQKLETEVLSDNYRKEIITLYRCIISWLVEEEHKSEMTRIEDYKIEVFSEDEMVLILGSDKFNLEMAIIYYTGMQIGEVVALKWEDVMMDEGIIKVLRTIQRVASSTTGETSKTRLVETEIPERNVPISSKLENFILQIPKSKRRGRVAESTESRTLQYKFSTIMSEIGILGTTTKLRDTFAVNAIKKGVNPVFIATVMGTTVEFFYKRYKYFIEETITTDSLRLVVEA